MVKKADKNTDIKVSPADLDGMNIDTMNDFAGTLAQLKSQVDYLIKEFGEESYVKLDAGYNNVSFQLVTEGMVEKKEKELREKAQKKEKELREKAQKKAAQIEANERDTYERLKKKFK